MLQADDKGVLYPVAQILVNVTNSYDIKQPEPELVEIAKFAKQHIPETHEKVIIPQLCLTWPLRNLVGWGGNNMFCPPPN